MNRDDKYIAMRRIGEAADQLSAMSNDLDRVGLSVLSEEVYFICKRLRLAVDDLHTIDGKEVADYINQTHQASANMLNACLAGAELAREHKPSTSVGPDEKPPAKRSFSGLPPC